MQSGAKRKTQKVQEEFVQNPYTYHHKRNKIINATTKLPKTIQRFRTRPKVIIDLFAGDLSIAKYYLQKYQNCRVLAVDRRSKDEALETVPKHLWSRILYQQYDIRDLTESKLEEWLWDAWKVHMQDVYHVHASPDCRTLSTADGSRVGEKMGKSAYRLPDGTPNPYAPQYRQERVKEADEAMRTALAYYANITRVQISSYAFVL